MALRNKAFLSGDRELAVCGNCNNLFLGSKKGRAKIWRRDFCRAWCSAKGGREA